MVEKILQEFKSLMRMDEITFIEIENFCRLTYLLGNNPLPSIRQWLTSNNIHLPVHYIESTRSRRVGYIKERVCGRVVPLLIVEAVKINGVVKKVNMFFIMKEKILRSKNFN